MNPREPAVAGLDAPSGVFAEPPHVIDVSECDFYHTMDLPGVGLIEGD
jgi:hypothetical protein